MTTHRDAPMRKNENINMKDHLLRGEQQEPEESLEYETETLPLTLLLILGTRIPCSGGDL